MMKPTWRPFALVLCGLGLCACEDRGSAPGDGGLPTDGAPTVECAAARPVDDASGLVGLLGGLRYDQVGPYTSIALPVTPDIVTGEFQLDAAELPLPEDMFFERAQASFRLNGERYGDVAGVVCAQKDPLVAGLCQRLRFTNSTVRFRAIVLDIHPDVFNLIPVVDVLPPCTLRCDDPTAILCARNGVCWSSYDEYCRLCLGWTKERCACLTATAPLGDGAPCEYFVSGDAVCGGVCDDGRCTSESCPE